MSCHVDGLPRLSAALLLVRVGAHVPGASEPPPPKPPRLRYVTAHARNRLRGWLQSHLNVGHTHARTHTVY